MKKDSFNTEQGSRSVVAVENKKGTTKYNNRWGKIAGIVVGAAMGIVIAAFTLTGCATPYESTPGYSIVATATDLEKGEMINLEAEWEEAITTEKQLILNWFTSDIATVETVSRLCEPSRAENFAQKSWCIGGADQLPEYNFGRFVEFLQLINSYYGALKTVDVNNVSSENFEEKFEEIIEELRAEFGIVVSDNEVTFEDIPTFENEAELKNNTYIVVNEGVGLTVIKNYDLSQTPRENYNYTAIIDDDKYEYGCSTGAAYNKKIKECPDSTFDVLFAGYGCDCITDLTKNGEPVDTIDYTAEEIFQLLAPIFEPDENEYEKFESVCNKYGFDIDTSYTNN